MGWPQYKIGEHFGVSQMQISKDVAAIRREWQRVMVEEFSSLKSEQLGKIDAAEAEAWRGWRRSLKTAEKRQARRVGRGEDIREETSRTEEGQSGDPRFLAIVMKCVERRCKLIGADAPVKIDITIEQMRAMTNEQLRAIAEGKPLLAGYLGTPGLN